jgi:hypothetical protein
MRQPLNMPCIGAAILDNFMPKRKDVRNPRAEYILSIFEYVACGLMTLPDGKSCGFVSEYLRFHAPPE